MIITPLKSAKDYLDNLTNIYEKKAPNKKRSLKKNFCNLNMKKDEIVSSFFTNISQVRHRILIIRVAINDDDHIQIIFDGLPYSWETLLATINGQEVQRNFEVLWN